MLETPIDHIHTESLAKKIDCVNLLVYKLPSLTPLTLLLASNGGSACQACDSVIHTTFIYDFYM